MMNISGKNKKDISLLNISYYISKSDYMAQKYADFNDETNTDDFNDLMDRGFIQDITCGTYNGALDKFDTWQITGENILNTILNAIHDYDFYEFVAQYEDDLNMLNGWCIVDWIKEFAEVYEVFIIDDRVYVNMD